MDLNADVGESYGIWRIGEDEQLIPLVTSVNVACGWHGGDAATIRATIALAKQYGVAVGVHPSYPDLQGFGRRAMVLTPREVEDGVLYQIGAVAAFARAADVPLRHVKPHGALYNQAADDPELAAAIVRAVAAWDVALRVVGRAGSALTAAAEAAGLQATHEAFIDRRYLDDGKLQDRRVAGAVLDEATAVEQAIGLIREGGVRTVDDRWITLHADSLCIHGDTPAAVALARKVRSVCEMQGIKLALPK